MNTLYSVLFFRLSVFFLLNENGLTKTKLMLATHIQGLFITLRRAIKQVKRIKANSREGVVKTWLQNREVDYKEEL